MQEDVITRPTLRGCFSECAEVFWYVFFIFNLNLLQKWCNYISTPIYRILIYEQKNITMNTSRKFLYCQRNLHKTPRIKL